MSLPKKILKCPIVEVIFEIRFDPNIEADAVFGLILNEIKPSYGKSVEKLPILQIPESIRSQDPNLKYQPHYKVTSDTNFSLQVGPRVISLLCTGDYVGWDSYSGNVDFLVSTLKNLSVAKKIERIGLRYINFFEGVDIFSRLALAINHPKIMFPRKQTTFFTQLTLDDEFSGNLKIANNGALSLGSAPEKQGSLFDIDVYQESDLSIDNLLFLASSAHNLEKNLFFSALQDSFITELQPEY